MKWLNEVNVRFWPKADMPIALQSGHDKAPLTIHVVDAQQLADQSANPENDC
jgi:hypothetical protein